MARKSQRDKSNLQMIVKMLLDNPNKEYANAHLTNGVIVDGKRFRVDFLTRYVNLLMNEINLPSGKQFVLDRRLKPLYDGSEDEYMHYKLPRLSGEDIDHLYNFWNTNQK